MIIIRAYRGRKCVLNTEHSAHVDTGPLVKEWEDQGCRVTITERHDYEVICGNIGTVHTGTNRKAAEKCYNFYVADSKTGLGRSGNEPVYLMKDGEPCREYNPPVSIIEWADDHDILDCIDRDGCYIAVVKQIDGTYHLEVEQNEGSIAAVYDTDTKNRTKAMKLRDELETFFTAKRIKVFKTHDEWEKFWENQ